MASRVMPLRLRHLNYTLKYLDCEAKGLRRDGTESKRIESLHHRWQRNERMKYERLSVVPSPITIMNNTYILELSWARGSSMDKRARFLYYFVLCCILLVLIVYAAVLFGGPGVVSVIVLVLLIFDFRKYRARR